MPEVQRPAEAPAELTAQAAARCQGEGIELWLAPFAIIGDEGPGTAAAQALLSQDERERAARFSRPADRQRFVQTRVLVRSLLARRLGRPPQSLVFETTPQGRPHCVGADGLDFNLTHTRDLVVVALAGAGAARVGVDAESLARPAPLNIARQLFAEAELAALQALPAAQRSRRFFALWTLKEAFAKAHGAGLGLPLRELAFALPGAEGLTFDGPAALLATGTAAAFWQFELPQGHLGALCCITPAPAAAARPEPPTLRAILPAALQHAAGDWAHAAAALDATQIVTAWRPCRSSAASAAVDPLHGAVEAVAPLPTPHAT